MKLYFLTPFSKCFIYFFVGICFFSCTKEKELDSQNAEKIIKEAFGFPRTSSRLFNFSEHRASSLVYAVTFLPFVDQKDLGIRGYDYLEQTGYLVTVPEIRHVPGEDYSNLPRFGHAMSYEEKGHLFFHFIFTGQEKPFITNVDRNIFEMRVSSVLFNSFTGLRKITENEYEAEFVLTTEITPFGEAYNLGIVYVEPRNERREIKLRNEIKPYRVRIFNYEDGWRIAPDDFNAINSKFE